MKSISGTIKIILLLAGVAFASDRGLVVGINSHTWIGNDATTMGQDFSYIFDTNYSQKSAIGFSIGAFYQLYSNPILKIEPELHWIMKGSLFKGKFYYDYSSYDTKIAFNLSYLEVPFLFKVSIAPVRNQPQLQIIGGPFLGFKTGASLVVSVDDEKETEKMDEFESTNYGYIIGGGIVMPSGFFCEVRYHRDLSSALGESEIYNQVIGLYIGNVF